jgi:hypothetical protein
MTQQPSSLRTVSPKLQRLRRLIVVCLFLLSTTKAALQLNSHNVNSKPTRPHTHIGSKALIHLDFKPLPGTTGDHSRRSAVSPRSSAPESASASDFELSVGHALDVLRRDYPKILVESPDFSIYDSNMELVDPSGVTLHGIATYRNSFRVLHALVKFIYCPERSLLTFRMCFDQARQTIRVHWNAQVVPRTIFGGVHRPLHVDGISVYEFDKTTGTIAQHRIEHLLINDVPVLPEEGVVAALTEHHTVTVPSFYSNEFRMTEAVSAINNKQAASLFALQMDESTDGGGETTPLFDSVAFDKKNKSRKKFGLKPLTRDEFVKLQAEVQLMDVKQRQELLRQQQQQQASAAELKKRPNLLQRMLGNLLQDTCESNYDCERPQVCCDFGFKKACCASGSPVGGELAYLRVPLEGQDYPMREQPGQGRRGGRGRY